MLINMIKLLLLSDLSMVQLYVIPRRKQSIFPDQRIVIDRQRPLRNLR